MVAGIGLRRDMKIGDTAECAIWLDGRETPEMVRQWRTDSVFLMERSRGEVLQLGPPRFAIKRPGDDRCPPVPSHISGPDVRLLVAEADVVGNRPKVARAGFLGELDKRDLSRLRAVTRRSFAKQYPGRPMLSNEQCDAFIEHMGPLAAANAAREAVDGKLVH